MLPVLLVSVLSQVILFCAVLYLCNELDNAENQLKKMKKEETYQERTARYVEDQEWN